MGILNCTPDSFSDGGRHLDAGNAVRHGLHMLATGADIVDVGGESTRPGAPPVDESEEKLRVVPVITGIRNQAREAILSVDTSKPFPLELDEPQRALATLHELTDASRVRRRRRRGPRPPPRPRGAGHAGRHPAIEGVA